MNDGNHSANRSLSFSQTEQIDQICGAFEAAWKKAAREDLDQPKLEEYLEQAPFPECSRLVRELFLIEFECLSDAGRTPSREEYRQRFPGYVTLLEAIWSGDSNRSTDQKRRSQHPEETAEDKAPSDINPFGTTLSVANRQLEDTATFCGVSEPSTAPDGLPSFSDYELLEEIGKGGMGVVYRARQKSADRIVALKVVRPERLDGFREQKRRDVIQRFRTEARAAARLDHENIVTVYDVGEDSDRHYYSMRFVNGKSLGDLIADEPLDARRAARYIELVARAVHEAHQVGILHRDLKPQNIIVDAKTDRPLVADFGLAKLSQEGRDLTIAGEVFGSPPFMSPEQALDSANVAAASDVYSLGATLYALLTGRPPFQGGSIPQILRRVIEDQPDRPRKLNNTVDRDLETICLKAMAKEPANRYASAEALANDLERYQSERSIRASRSSLGALRRIQWDGDGAIHHVVRVDRRIRQ